MSSRDITEWELIYREWNAEEQPLREALCALGNGQIVTRGAFEEVRSGGVHYPGTYLAGGYNRLETTVEGHVLENEDLVNFPNWLPLSFRPADGEWLNLSQVDVLDFSLRLDLNRGVLHRHVRFRDERDRSFTLETRRFVHMRFPHLAGIEWHLTSHDWSGTLEIRTGIDGSVHNDNVARYRDLNSQHLEVLEVGFEGDDALYLTAETNQSHICMAQAVRTRLFQGDKPVPLERQRHEEKDRVAQDITVECRAQKTLRIEKIASIYSSEDFAISEPQEQARKSIRRAGSFDELITTHETRWAQLWSHSDIALHDGDAQTQLILRLHIFHLLQTTSPNTIDRDVGVPARGWHGEAYRGHVLWDELFIFPFLTLRIPELTRSLLMYRFRRLPEARHLAAAAGFAGAMYPWQSASDGREESQVLHLNPRSGRWIPDDSNIQRHVNSAIAYNVWQYYQATADVEFLSYYGAEMLLEIARFWASIATYNADRKRYEIRAVMGPDEFHTSYPDREATGLDNNAYTNVMAVWVLRTACSVLDQLDEQRRRDLRDDLRLVDEELARWHEVSQKMFVPFHNGGIISQFEGYADLEEFDWNGYKAKYGDIQRLDRILESEGDDVNRYKASKQADVLMLFFLFSTEELESLFNHMGYAFDPQTIPKNIDYYIRRTSDGSTLSRIVHSWVLARSDREGAWKLFEEALHSDIEDIQGGTTSEGIHLGAMAGTVDLIQSAHTGLEMRDEILWFNPLLPYELSDVRLRIRYRGHWLSVQLTDDVLRVSFDRGWSEAAKIGFRDSVVVMQEGETHVFSLQKEDRKANDRYIG